MPLRLCLACGRSFGVLPEGLLPIMRWFLTDLRLIAGKIEAGTSSRQLARLYDLSLGVIRRLRVRLPELDVITQQLFLAAGNPAGIFTDWVEFARQLSRALYPKLHLQVPAPHKL